MLPPQFDLERYYSAGYFQGGAVDGYADYAGSESSLRAEFRQTLAHILRLAPRRGALLEFGCAYGYFLEEAARHFDSTLGIELSAEAVAIARARGLNVQAGVVDDALAGPFDAVVGLDVIEHVPEPAETVAHLSRVMAPNGVLVLTTGDWGSPLARVMGPRWRLMTPPQHVSFFTPKAMQALLNRAGLVVVEISRPWKRVPLALFAYQAQRILGLRPRVLRIPGALRMNLFDAMRVTARKP